MADLALEVAGRFDAEVFLLRVDLDSAAGFENYLWSLSADEVTNREAAQAPGVPQKPMGQGNVHLEHAAAMPAAAAIIDFAQQHEVDLIMMAAYTHSILGRRVFGGVQLEVLRWAPCAVLTGRRERAAKLVEKPVRHILSPIDFSDRSRKAFDAATELADRYKAGHTALHVIEERIIPRLTERGWTRATSPYDESYSEHAEEALREFVVAQSKSNTPVSCSVSKGYVGAKTAEFAIRSETDLIVISAKGMTDDPDVELGGSADRIVRKAPCPVLTVK